MIIAFTDGITDIRSENGDVFGIQGVIDSIQYQTPHLIGDMLNQAIRFQKTDKFNDDIIILTVCIDDNASELLWNIFSAPDRSVFRLKTCYMNIDRLVDLVMAHIAEKFGTARISLSKIKIAFFRASDECCGTRKSGNDNLQTGFENL
ncbi:MAG: SpoIIE family protein phosphatase [Desulfobacteraceae bacterium]|nr:SpoIIE family protein phosphatase [Desulfobacteraceae bacterium]